MLDMLNRQVKEFDLVVVKPTGRDSRGLDIGIKVGGMVRCRNTKGCYSECYLIENPTNEELEIKKQILKDMSDEKIARIQEQNRRKKLKRLPKKEIEIGELYTDEKGKSYYYLGTGSYSINSYYSYNNKRGAGFILIPKEEYDYQKEEYFFFDRVISRITFPKFVKKENSTIPFKLTNKIYAESKEYRTNVTINLDMV
ncbi:hypothetical protein P5F71_07825 [Clostridium perfringens]|nr:hypothetical protein [Clostridium perfringens]